MLLLLCLTGCHVHQLSSQYAPLEQIREQPISFSDNIVTIRKTIWVANLADYLRRNKPGTPDYISDMIHERVHSIREQRMGTLLFICRYAVDRTFMWREEQIAVYFALMYLKRNRCRIDVDFIARGMSDYCTLFLQPMVSYNDAKHWIRAVLQGRWQPPIPKEDYALYALYKGLSATAVDRQK